MIPLCAKSFARGGGGTIATTDGHKPPTPPLFFSDLPPAQQHRRHTPRNPAGSKIAVLRAKRKPERGRPVTRRGHTRFGVLRSSRQVGSRLARARHQRRQSSATSEFCDITEFRCPDPTPSDAASPVSRVPKPTPHGRLQPITPVCRECNTAFIPSRYAHHITTSLHITSHAPTEPAGVGSQGIGKTRLRRSMTTKLVELNSLSSYGVLCRIMQTPLRFVMTTACIAHTAMFPQGCKHLWCCAHCTTPVGFDYEQARGMQIR